MQNTRNNPSQETGYQTMKESGPSDTRGNLGSSMSQVTVLGEFVGHGKGKGDPGGAQWTP